MSVTNLDNRCDEEKFQDFLKALKSRGGRVGEVHKSKKEYNRKRDKKDIERKYNDR